jgi:hypothetical protein
VESGKMHTWKLGVPDESQPLALIERPTEQVAVAVVRNFEFKLPLAWLLAVPVASTPGASISESNAIANKLRLRFSLWQNALPIDALPEEGWMELPLLSQQDLITHW